MYRKWFHIFCNIDKKAKRIVEWVEKIKLISISIDTLKCIGSAFMLFYHKFFFHHILDEKEGENRNKMFQNLCLSLSLCPGIEKSETHLLFSACVLSRLSGAKHWSLCRALVLKWSTTVFALYSWKISVEIVCVCDVGSALTIFFVHYFSCV